MMNKFFLYVIRFRDFIAKKEVGWNASQIETQVYKEVFFGPIFL